MSIRKKNPDARIPNEIFDAAELVANYLSELWQLPCYDCWEEFPDHVHPHTLAAIYGGLRAHAELAGTNYQPLTDALRNQLLDGAQPFGHFAKFPDSPAVDASLLGLAVPYAVVAVNDPIMLKTVDQIESTIVLDGGVHRYADDSYYGGGAWILLTAWLGWYYSELAAKCPFWAGRLEQKIKNCQKWIEAHAGNQSYLPEQVAENLHTPSYHQVWVERWGEVASPLLWSHANYIILHYKNSNHQ